MASSKHDKDWSRKITDRVKGCSTVHLDTESGKRTGMQVSNHERGIIVRKVTAGDAGHCAGVRAGDVICCINGIPCLSHVQSVAILDAAPEAQIPVILSVLKRSRTPVRWKWLERYMNLEEKHAGTSSNTVTVTSSQYEGGSEGDGSS